MKHIKLFEQFIFESKSFWSMTKIDKIKVGGSGKSYWVTNDDAEDILGNISYTLSAKNMSFYEVTGSPANAEKELVKMQAEELGFEEEELEGNDSAISSLEVTDLSKGKPKFLAVFYSEDSRDISDIQAFLVPEAKNALNLVSKYDEDMDWESMEMICFEI